MIVVTHKMVFANEIVDKLQIFDECMLNEENIPDIFFDDN